MVKINREYLDPALQALNQHNNALLKKYNAQQEAVHSASQAVADRQHSKLISSRNLSRGGMIAIVLIGFGIMVSLIAWSLPRLVGELRSPITNLQPTLDLSSPSTEPSSTGVSNSPDDVITNAPLPALIVPDYPVDLGSTGCIVNESFKSPCTDSIVLENGSTFTGTWRNGAANGDGTITFSDEGSIQGTWRDGALIEVIRVNTPEATTSIKSSVTVFKSKSVPELSSKFTDVVVGHKFSSTNDPTWDYAFCYVNVIDGNELFRVDLSDIENFNEKITLKSYKTKMRVSRSEFEIAQKMCPYKYTDF